MKKPHKSTHDQTFRYRASTALSVQLIGDFTHWQRAPINLRKDPNGVWRTTVKLDPGDYHYRFMVDGQWQDDPEYLLRLGSNPKGSKVSRQRRVAGCVNG